MVAIRIILLYLILVPAQISCCGTIVFATGLGRSELLWVAAVIKQMKCEQLFALYYSDA